MMKQFLLLAITGLFSCSAIAQGPSVEAFPLSDIRLLEGPFQQAEQRDLEYLLALDPDRLLAPFQKEAGIAPKADLYGNWEAGGLGGHIGGHYLTALSLMYASTGNPEMLRHLNYMVEELKKCQDRNPDGYVGGVPGGVAMWADVAAGKINTESFSLNGKWVPWYNMHKLFAGLRDAWLYAGNEQARSMLIKLADWALQLAGGLDDAQIQQMLKAEQGGMNEVLADVTAITGDRKYLGLAQRFSHRYILDPLLRREDKLTGIHANTQIPKVIGFERIAELGGNSAWSDAAQFFWQTVVDHRTVAIGGNSVREHFNPVDDFSSMLSDVQGPETCNTYNMLKLSKLLYQHYADLKYIDYYERALYNHILSSEHPDHGGFVYFTPMRACHYRVYSQPQECFWCCVGSGLENHAKYGELIYAHKGDTLMVNLFIPSTLFWKEKNTIITQETRFPDEETTVISIDPVQPAKYTVMLRCPRWVAPGKLQVRVNDQEIQVDAAPGNYFAITRQWQKGDKIAMTLPMQTTLEPLPDGSDYYAFVHGPIVLAAKTGAQDLAGLIANDSRMGHVATGKIIPWQEAPLFVGEKEAVLANLKKVKGKPLTYSVPGSIYPASSRNLELIPFFRLHDARYVIYWQITTPEGLQKMKEALATQEKERLALEAQTIDQVAPGEQQPEVEHAFASENSESGIHLNRHWRHAAGWFSYRLVDKKKEAAKLRITYYGLDTGRHFDILINDQKLAEVHLDGSHGNDFFEVDYAIPAAIRQAGALTVKFVAHPGSLAGGVYGVRLMRGGD